MILYPKLYCDKVTDITVDYLLDNGIKAMILDVDNTLIDFDKNMIEGLEDWIKKIKEANIIPIIVSNTNKLEKVKTVANILEIDYIYFAIKPLKRGFKKARKALGNIEPEHIAVVGDQIFTDVIGANRCKMFPILVKPVGEKDHWMTRFKRPLEEKVIKKYLKKNEG